MTPELFKSIVQDCAEKHFNQSIQSKLLVTKWKDGIDISEPCQTLLSFSREVVERWANIENIGK